MSLSMRVRSTRDTLAIRLCLAAAASSMAFFMAGCANMVTTSTQANSFVQGATIGGRVHGGNQPVTGATVRLYAAGTTGYGSAGTLFATTTTSNDAFGSFNFTKLAVNTGTLTPTTPIYGCPITGDPQMYIVATGGETQGTGNGTNTAAAFIAAIGKCSTISAATFIDLTEVTTVATMAALQQYFSPVTESFGYPNTTLAALGYANGLATIANLIDIRTGSALLLSSRSATPSGATAAVQVDILPEYAKINTIANITAACVNTTSASSSNCATLFANTPPPVNTTTSQPTIVYPATTIDVLQATYYMLSNPGSGGAVQINALFALPSASSPFQPTLAKAPTDWTVGIRYSSASGCTTGIFLDAPYDLATDAAGNLWIASGGASTTSSNLLAISPNGVPSVCALGASVNLTKGLTIDTAGNVWIAGNVKANPYYKYNIATNTFTTWPVPAASVPYVVAADANGNIFFTDSGSKVWEFPGGATAAAPVTAVQVATVQPSPFYIAVDTAGRVFVTQSQASGLIYDIYPSTDAGNLNGFLQSQIGTAANVTSPFAIAAGLNGTIAAANGTNTASTAAQTHYFFTPSNNPPGTATFTPNSIQYAGGLNTPRGPNAVDGAGNSWVASSTNEVGSYVTGVTNSFKYAIQEFAADNTPISPNSTSLVANQSNSGYQKEQTLIPSPPRAVAIDLTGNVWMGTTTATGNGVVEYVGAGVPVVTPVSIGLLNGAGTGNAVQKP